MSDEIHFGRALELGASVRATTSPNPWVGCVIVTPDGQTFEGATQPVGGAHAEAMALAAAGDAAVGSTAYVTLEPCCHIGRTPPCADALVDAGLSRVVIGLHDPDPLVAGSGVAWLRDSDVQVDFIDAALAAEATASLLPYLVHRRTGRPYVVLKLAASIDGRTAAPDGSSQWITSSEARADAHQLRSESDVIIVGAGTVSADDPSLTVRLVDAPGGDPRRVVLGSVQDGAKVLPAEQYHGDLDTLLDRLGAEGAIQVLVEGGASVAHDFHVHGLVDRYVIYLAPALFGGNDARGLFVGPGTGTIDDVWRGRFERVTRIGTDIRVDVVPADRDETSVTSQTGL